MHATSKRHVCSLPRRAGCTDVAPTAAWWQRCRCRLRRLTLASERHRGAMESLRSRANMAAERRRQLASPHACLLHPYSSLYFYWQCCIVLLWAATNFYVPLIAILREKSGNDLFLIFTDVIAVVDIAINFRTGYQDTETKEIILDPKKIALKYAKGRFIFDLLGAFPFGYIQTLYPSEIKTKHALDRHPVVTCFYVTKAFRFITLHNYWTVIHRQLRLSYSTIVLTTSFVQSFYFLHWLTYVYYQFPLFMARFRNDEVHPSSWFNIRNVDLQQDTALGIYTASLYYVTALAIGAGYFNPPGNDHLIEELLLTSFIAILGLVFFSYTLLALLRLGMHANFQVYSYHAKLKEIERYMQNLKLPDYLQKKILLYIKYKYNGRHFEEDAIMNILSKQMKQEIHMYCSIRLVENVRLFDGVPKPLLRSIIQSLIPEVHMPGEYLVHCGQIGNSMYFVSRGTVAVIYANGKEAAHLVEGANFGEAALLLPGRPLPISIVALEMCEVYRLDTEDFQYCMSGYPHLMRRLQETVSKRPIRGDYHPPRRDDDAPPSDKTE